MPTLAELTLTLSQDITRNEQERAAALATGLAAAAQVLAEADDDAHGRDDAGNGGAS